jgi:hypothetical protein
LSKELDNEVPSRGESLFGRDRPGFGVSDTSFGRLKYCWL